ncbi:hypothetical protein [Dokdonella ginsengisoli]|uniref:Uncharacterized protein n=1 Tax=Dokdonella ginsengisoli TaxID=363846 RepID=A0ABV9QRY0_9GAMM
MFKFLRVLALACFSAGAAAQTIPPVDGFYLDPGQGGRGYAVETQDDQMFVALFNYDEDSRPTFYTIQGTWNPATRRVNNASLYQVSSGPWIGGAYMQPGPAINKGPVTLEFPTPTTGRLVYNGRTSTLQRFLFGYGASASSLMQGAWHTTFGSVVAFGDFIEVTGPCTLSSCSTIPEAFVGRRLGSSSNVLVGGKLPDGRVMILLDSSPSYYALYVFELRVNQWVGFENTFLKTETDTPTSGVTMVAARLLPPSLLKTEGAQSTADMEALNALSHEASVRAVTASASGKSSVEASAMLPRLRSALGELR